MEDTVDELEPLDETVLETGEGALARGVAHAND